MKEMIAEEPVGCFVMSVSQTVVQVFSFEVRNMEIDIKRIFLGSRNGEVAGVLKMMLGSTLQLHCYNCPTVLSMVMTLLV